jgi:DNA-binding transcriptional MerR regulator
MAVLEKVLQMQQQGMSEGETIRRLRQEGHSPKEINEAISQSKIKSAIDTNPVENSEAEYPQNPLVTNETQMQQSIMPPETAEAYEEYPAEGGYETYPPQAEEGYGGAGYGEYQAPAGGYETYPQEGGYEYPAYPEYGAARGADIETINDIAEQIIEEKNAELRNQISSFSAFQKETAEKIEKIDKRLEKIENLFENLQMNILGKISDYGKDIQNISTELRATQDAFSKVINPLADTARKLEKSRK